MAKVFISYSSKNKEFALKLAADLKALSHEPWLDEWEIRVGDCIPTKIEDGIEEADYVVVVLSAHSVESGWVEREWKTKYWQEVNEGKIRVLPALIEDCESPPLLRTKRYADFRQSYGAGLVRLTAAIDPAFPASPTVRDLIPGPADSELFSLIQKLQSPSSSLSETVAAVLTFAHRTQNSELTNLCAKELAGYPGGGTVKGFPSYRLVEVFASTNQINMQYIGWDGSTARILEYMGQNPEEFIPQKLAVGVSLAEIEEQAARTKPNQLLHLTRRLGEINPEAKKPDLPVYLYGRGDTFGRVLTLIRGEISRCLIALLPGKAS